MAPGAGLEPEPEPEPAQPAAAEEGVPKSTAGSILAELHAQADFALAGFEAEERYKEERGLPIGDELQQMEQLAQKEFARLQGCVRWKGWLEKAADGKTTKASAGNLTHKWDRRFFAIFDEGPHTGHVAWFKKEEHLTTSATAKPVNDPELRWVYEKARGSVAITYDTHCDVAHENHQVHMTDTLHSARTLNIRCSCESWERANEAQIAYLHKCLSVIRGIAINVPANAPGVCLIDPVGVGGNIARLINEAGYHCVRINTNKRAFYQTQREHVHASYSATLFYENIETAQGHNEENIAGKHLSSRVCFVLRSIYVTVLGCFADLARDLQHNLDLGPDPAHSIIAVLTGSESGGWLAARLGDLMLLKHNDPENAEVWHDAAKQMERLAAYKLRVPRTGVAHTGVEAMEYLKAIIPQEAGWSSRPFKVVVKPAASVGGEKVMLCTTLDDVGLACDLINKKKNLMGIRNKGAVVQEYINGDEYVIDSVSNNDEHKILAMWTSDRVATNGVGFVTQGKQLVDVQRLKDTAQVDQLVLFESIFPYHDQVLDALGVHNGPAHMKIVLDEDGPCIVKLAVRCHDCQGTWLQLVDKATGYNQVQKTLAVYTNDDAAWESIPPRPSYLNVQAAEVNFIMHTTGICAGYPGLEALQRLSSYIGHTFFVKPGEELQLTVDEFTRPGTVMLAHADAATLERDYAAVVALDSRYGPDGVFAVQSFSDAARAEKKKKSRKAT